MRWGSTTITVATILVLLAPTGAGAGSVDETVQFTAPFGSERGWFGRALAIDGDTAFIAGLEYDDAGTWFGSAVEFTRTETGWSQGIVLRSERPFDWFGAAIALDGDTLAIGAPGYCDSPGGDGSTPGRVHVYRRIDGMWDPEAVIEKWACGGFGFSVDIAGDVVAVGSLHDEGSSIGAFLYERSGSTWNEAAHLKPPPGSDPYSGFGENVATDGTYVVVGEFGSYSDHEPGRAHVYERTDGAWAPIEVLTASDGTGYDAFGWDVGVSDGTVVVGATAAADLPADAGAAYVFTAVGGWAQAAKLVASDAVAGDQLGWSVAIDGDAIAVGARSATVDDQPYAGSSYLFERSGDVWQETAIFEASDAAEGGSLGSAIAIDARRVLAGAPEHDTPCGQYAGAAYIFSAEPSGERQDVKGVCGSARPGPRTSVSSLYAITIPGLVIPISGESVGEIAPVSEVLVTLRYIHGGFQGTYDADVVCVDLSCTWSVDPPTGAVSTSQIYMVTAQGIDEQGSYGVPSAPAPVVVVGYP